MNLTALLSWYDEDPEWLTSTIASLPKAGVTRLIALDGAYGLYPDAAKRSDEAQHEAIRQACKDHGIRRLICTPAEVWSTEMGKRSHLFRLGDLFPADWYVVIDGDETIQDCPDDLHQRLESADRDVGEVRFHQPHPQALDHWFPLRIFFRAIPGIRVVGNHYTYLTPNGTKLWGRGRQVPALDLTDLLIEHRTHLRAEARKAQARTYYQRRDQQLIEVGRCERCGGEATKEIPTDWRERQPGLLSSDWISVCIGCEPAVKAENTTALKAFGLDPSTIQVNLQRARA